MIKYVFPYGFQLKWSGKIVIFPTVNVSFWIKRERGFFSLLLVDSGAETTLLTKNDAKTLGIEIEKGKEIIIRGITIGLLRVFRHEVMVKIGEERMKIPVLFSTSDESPRVLGREGIFDKFFILFDEKQKQTIFILRNDDAQRQMEAILG